MAFGLIRGCIKLMQQVKGSLGHVNQYLEKQPEDFEKQLAQLEGTVAELCKTPFSPDPVYFRRVVEARLAAGEASVEAAHYAMLHQARAAMWPRALRSVDCEKPISWPS